MGPMGDMGTIGAMNVAVNLSRSEGLHTRDRGGKKLRVREIQEVDTNMEDTRTSTV